MQMIAKVARRLHKVNYLIKLSPSDDRTIVISAQQCAGIVVEAVQRARALLDSRWTRVIEKERTAFQLSPESIPTHDDFLNDTRHNVGPLKSYIEALKNSASEIGRASCRERVLAGV